jgi:fibronectin-binding autotransporter adhesin
MSFSTPAAHWPPSLNAASLAVNSLSFLSTASSFTFNSSGGYGLTLNGGGITNNAANTETFTATVTLGANQAWYGNAGSLVMKAVNLGAYNLTTYAAGGSNLFLNGTVSGAGSLTVTGPGTVVLGGSNTFTGGLNLNQGTVVLANTYALNAANSNALVFGGGTLSLNGRTAAVASIAGTAGTINNTYASGTATLTLYQFSNTVYSGFLTDGGTGKLAVAKNGTGTLTLSASNSYSGGTTINAGAVRIQNSSALGTSTINVTGTGAVQLDGNGLAVGDALTDNSDGGGTGGLENLANNNTWKGKITAGASGGRINSDGGTLTVSGGVAGSSAVRFGGAGKIVVNTVGISGALAVTKDGSGTLELDTLDSFTGGTTLTSGHILLGANGALGSGGLTFAGGILDANGKTASPGALSLTANSTLNLSASSSLTFSSANDASGAILVVNGWAGAANASGTVDHLYISANPGSAVLADIQFAGYAPGATRLSTGEIVPVPEPITWAMILFGATVGFVRFGLPRLRRALPAA